MTAKIYPVCGKWIKVTNGSIVQVQPHLTQVELEEGDWLDSIEGYYGDLYDETTGSIIHPQQLKTRSEKIEEIRVKCGEAIVSGFDSSALGYLSHYRCNRDDQNTMRNAHEDSGGKIWRNEDFTYHLGSEASQVWQEAKLHILQARERYYTKVNEIQDTNLTQEQYNEVSW